MKLRILHRTEYRYALPVRNNSNELRVTPIDNPRQRTILHLVRVLPAVMMRRYQDLYHNKVSFFEVEETHKSLIFDVSSVVETKPTPFEAIPADTLFAALAESEIKDSFQPFLLADGPVQITPQIWRTAIDIKAECKEVLPVVQGLLEFVHQTCQYVPGATTLSTSTEEFFGKPQGVCQDFAHLLLALCRAIGIPARYACGYVYDQKRGAVLGGHASHAWCEVWIPGFGWVGLDPTNHRFIDEAYVASAIGRDYRDTTPVRGSYWGTADREMRVTVHVEAK